MRLLLLFTVLASCWQLSGAVLAQMDSTSSSANRQRLARPVIDNEQVVEMFGALDRLRQLRARQRELDLKINGLFGFLWLTTIDIPAINASMGLVFTGTDADSSTARPAPQTATEALQQLEQNSEQQEVHPLQPWIEYASSRLDYVKQHVRDHTCLLIKRERIDGLLSEHQYMLSKSRQERVQDGKVVVPLSVYVHYLSPAKLRGRKVLYVAGQNDGKMLVRKGGTRFDFVTVKVDPTSRAALRESHYPITQMGIDQVIQQLIEQASEDIAADPQGTNTEVGYFKDAKINNRSCIHVRVVHPQRQDGLNFHVAELYVDDELQLPIRIEGYDWPREEGASPELIEEFTYTNLKINVGLTAADFTPQVLE